MDQLEQVEARFRGKHSPHSLSFLLLRACLVCVFLVGSVVAIAGHFSPHAVTAQGLTPAVHFPKVAKIIPHHALMRHVGYRKHIATKLQREHVGIKRHRRQVLKLTPTTVVATPVSTPFVKGSLKPMGSSPDLYIERSNFGGKYFKVGKTLTYVLLVGNNSKAAPVLRHNSIMVTDIIPLGLKQLKAKGKSWKISLSDKVSPAILRATYIGKYPVKASAVLPLLTLTGTLTKDAEPAITNTTTVSMANVRNARNISGADTIFVGTQSLLPGSPVASTSTPASTVLQTPTPTTIRVNTIPPTPTVIPNFHLVLTRPSAPVNDSYTVGQPVSYVLSVNNVTMSENQLIRVLDIVSLGLTNITLIAPNWTTHLSNTVGPAVITATYNGPYPVAVGTLLPPITLTGVLSATAGAQFSNAAVVLSEDDPNSGANVIVDSLALRAAPITTVTPTPIALATPTLNTNTTVGIVSATPTALPATPPVVTATVAVPAMPTPLLSPTPTLSTPVTGGLPISIPTLPATDTPTATVVAPNLTLVNANLYGANAQVGGAVNFVLVAFNAANSITISKAGTIAIDEVIPVGLSNIQAQGKNWQVSVSDTTSPTIIHAQFVGHDPIVPGTQLSPITITGELNGDAVPLLTSTATVTVGGVSYSDNYTSSDTLFVHAQPKIVQHSNPRSSGQQALFQRDHTKRRTLSSVHFVASGKRLDGHP